MWPPKQNPPASKLDAQDAVNLIDQLVIRHIALVAHALSTADPIPKPEHEEQIAIIKRDLTDYLLSIDPRPGLYIKGPNDG